MSLDMDKVIKQYKKDHSCKCPFCGYDMNTESEDMQDHVTYWGEDGAKEASCPRCDKDFWIEEHVDRTWTTKKVEFYKCRFCDRPALDQEEHEQPSVCWEHDPGR